jgi:hypothetical protein
LTLVLTQNFRRRLTWFGHARGCSCYKRLSRPKIRSSICRLTLIELRIKFWAELRTQTTTIGVRDGGAGGGGSCPPQKITKSKSRANVQHKSGEEWKIKKPKSPQFVGQTKAVGQYLVRPEKFLDP